MTAVVLANEAGTISVQRCDFEAAPNLYRITKALCRNGSITRQGGVISKTIGQFFCTPVDVIRIPDQISLEAAALLEPLSVAIHATRRASIEQGDTIVVFGAGTVGLLTAAMAKLSGATTVVIADIDAGRVEYALRNHFATKGFVVPIRQSVEETSQKLDVAIELATDILREANDGYDGFEGADVSFDCTGKEVCVQAGLFVSKIDLSADKVLILLGHSSRRTVDHGGHGNANTDFADVCGAIERG